MRHLHVALVAIGLIAASATTGAATETGQPTTAAALVTAAPLVAATPEPAADAIAPPAASSKPAAAATAKEEKKPVPTGLERLSDDWPKWVKVGVQYRGRLESTHPTTTANGVTDAYYLNRIRLRTTVVANKWLNGTFEAHDMQVMLYDGATTPRGYANSFDVRQGFVEATPVVNGTKLLARVGRQELTLGDGRLLGSPDWGNSSRTFDVIRAGAETRYGRVDLFDGGMVLVDATHFDRITPGERFYGAYGSLPRVVHGGVVEPYYIVRTLRSTTSERGGTGEAAIRTFGARATAKTVARLDLALEFAAQRGHMATDAVDAWAGHAALGWTPAHAPAKLRLAVEYNAASGDSDAHDGRRQTFDQLYPSNHAKYGFADQIGWRNMRDLGVGAEFAPLRKMKMALGAHKLALATLNDGYYNSGGTRLLFNTHASGRNIGWETDATMTWSPAKEQTFGAGLGTLWSGDYLIGANHDARITFPHVFWTTKF